MLNRSEIIEKAYECGFGDIGFASADPFETQKELLQERHEDYEWAFKAGLDRVAAARAGLGTFGKNCLFYSNKVVGRGSWVLPIALVVDQEFVPDEPTLEVGCPHAEKTLSNALSKGEGLVRDEIRAALEKC